MTDGYQMDIKDNMLVFKTTSFKAEKGSMLHSGIYNRELASSLVAGALILLSGFFFAARYKITAIHFLAAMLIFAALFIGFRTYIFREPLLSVIIDKDKKEINFSLNKIFRKKNFSFLLSDLKNIRQDYVSIVPENSEGIKFVEKIALQHGSIIPGFGKTEEFYTVLMEHKGGQMIVIFSSHERSMADDIATKFKNFIEG